MVGKFLFFLSAATATFLGLSADAVTTSQNVDIIVTHGAPLTTFTFVNNSGNTLPAGTPVSFGQGFRYGDIMPGTYPLIRDAITHTPLTGQQWNEISTWRENGGNGSWRHAVWTAWLPASLAAGASYQVEFISASGNYAETSHQPLSALCSGPAAHDLKIHLTDVRNLNDTVRDSGDATFRVCDNINNTGRDAPRHLDAGNVMDEYVVSGLFTYATSGHKDPQLYAQCNIDLFTQAADGTSPGDVRWMCHVLSPWMAVAEGSTGHAGNIGPAGFANDPQMVSYRAEILDGSSVVLDWSGLDASIPASSANLIPITDANTHGGNCNYYIAYQPFCLQIPSSTGTNAWYYGQANRVTCTGTCLAGLTNDQLVYVYPSGQATLGPSNSQWVQLQPVPWVSWVNIMTGSVGTGTTSFSARIPHYHWQGWQTADTTGLMNWSPRGTTSRVTRKVYPKLTPSEQLYWEQSGIIVPLLLGGPGQPADNQLVYYGGGLSELYDPMGRMNMIGTGGPGARSDIGIANEYSAQAFVSQTEHDWDNARLATYASSRDGWNTVFDEATARIPVLNNGPPTGPGGNGNGGSYTGLGAGNDNNANNKLGWAGGWVEGPAVTPAGKLNPAGYDISGGMVFTGPDHMPNFNGFSYMLFGDRTFLDIMQWRAEADVVFNTIGPMDEPCRDHVRDNVCTYTDGKPYHYWGFIGLTNQSRGSSWTFRDVTYGATFGADDYPLAPAFSNNPERAYFHDILIETGNYYKLHEAYMSGPGSVAAEGSLYAANSERHDQGPFDEVFIRSYQASADYLMTAWLHEPFADYLNLIVQKGYEGIMGKRVYGGPSTYYAVDYTTNADIVDADFETTWGLANIGPHINGVDGADWAHYGAIAQSLLTGGQWVLNTGDADVSQGGRVKYMFGYGQSGGATKIDQLPGNRWFNMINTDNVNKTYYLQCTDADHAQFPAQCPVAGGPFTGYTQAGVAMAATDASYLPYPKMRFNWEPPVAAGSDYFSPHYTSYMGQGMAAEMIMGYDVSHALADLDLRAPVSQFNTTTPQYNWDRNVVVPGLPAVVTYSDQFATLSCGAPAGTVVASLGLVKGNGNGPGAWTIPMASDPAHFAISGNNLVTAGTIPCDKSYMVRVQTTQSGGRSVLGELHPHVKGAGG